MSAVGAFLVGHGVGNSERLAALRARERANLAGMTKTAFQGWSLVCRDMAASGSSRRCVLFMAIADPAMRQVLLSFSVARTPQGVPVLLVDTPAGVSVDQGVTVTPGAAESVKMRIQTCGPQRCRAVTQLDSALQAALEAADMTSVTYVRANRQQSTYNLPTRGFREGFAAWSAETARLPVSTAAN
jgi:invasion protein IalB